jgi:hypothetical protein
MYAHPRPAQRSGAESALPRQRGTTTAIPGITHCHRTQRQLDAPDPPFGTPRPMTIWQVADIQNRLFWRAGTGGLLSAAFPPRDGIRHPEIGNDCHDAG